jgi:hypothetical protein
MALQLIGSLLLVLALEPTPAPTPAYGLPLLGEEAETFLRTAQVVAREEIPVGISKPEKLTLSDRGRTLHAAFKTINQFEMKKELDRGQVERNFRDTYKHEIAAYELDKLIGLGMVPPTVERRVGGERGSLQLWVEGAFTEYERQTRGLRPPNMELWNRQIHNVRLFHQLTYNTDYRNIRNLLVDPGFKVYLIDASRSFRLDTEVRKEEALVRFSRPVLDRLRGLSRELCEQRLGEWLSGEQVKALLARRDQIVARAEQLVATQGEETVLFP